jgi:transposase
MPGIGPVTALAFVAALDDVTRFHSAHQVQAYLGLVPSEYRSGDHRLRGHITKRGDARMRWLLVETAWRILRSTNPELTGAEGVGAADRPAARQTHRDRRAGAPRRRYPLRDVARRRAVPGNPDARGRCLATSLPNTPSSVDHRGD